MENVFRIELNFFGIVILTIIFWLFHNNVKIKNKENKVFLLLCCLTFIELILDSAFWLIDGSLFSFCREVNIMLNTLYYFLQIVQCYVWMIYCEIHMSCKENKWKRRLLSVVLFVGVALLIANLWTGYVFSVDQANVYSRSWGIYGTIEAICCMFYLVYCVILTIIKIISGDKKTRKDGLYLFLVSVIPIIFSVIQIVVYGLNFIWVGMAMALLLVFVNVEIKQHQKLQQELTEQRIQIMLSQIQPHFLYNSLGAIEYLCDHNPQKAKEAVSDFSKYLRVNLDSLKQSRLVPFETELKHVKVYLSLEKMRFEDQLHIVYSVRASDFSLPALTVQPLVENAVKYGVGQKKNGGTVSIITSEQEENYIIVVKDDGIGFDVNRMNSNDRLHLGIENVENRLKAMCGGTLNIISTKGEGTIVTVKIPKEMQKNVYKDK